MCIRDRESAGTLPQTGTETDPEVNSLSTINPDEIISILKEEIENYDEISKNQEVGTVISVGDGIATVYGIDPVSYTHLDVYKRQQAYVMGTLILTDMIRSR